MGRPEWGESPHSVVAGDQGWSESLQLRRLDQVFRAWFLPKMVSRAEFVPVFPGENLCLNFWHGLCFCFKASRRSRPVLAAMPAARVARLSTTVPMARAGMARTPSLPSGIGFVPFVDLFSPLSLCPCDRKDPRW